MGDNAKAIHWFNKSLSYHVMGNPAYAKGFIAFLQNDKQALLADRKSVANSNPGPWTSQDLKEMDAMIDYFGAPFEAAWGALNCIGTGAKADPQWAKFCRAMSANTMNIYAQHFRSLRTQ